MIFKIAYNKFVYFQLKIVRFTKLFNYILSFIYLLEDEERNFLFRFLAYLTNYIEAEARVEENSPGYVSPIL